MSLESPSTSSLRGKESSKWLQQTTKDVFDEETRTSVALDEEIAEETDFEIQQHRRQDEVERFGNLDCRLTTSMVTPYQGRNTAKGTMFTVDVKEPIDLLGLEFDAYDYDVDGVVLADLSVEVFYRQGDYSGVTSDPSQWIELTNSEMYLEPNGEGAIIPSQNFNSVTLEAGSTYSFYLSFQTSGVLKIQNSKKMIGDIYERDDALDLMVGVSLDDGPFPESFYQPADFGGRLHYRSLRSCTRALTTTNVELQFAINNDPEEEYMNALATAVENAMSALSILNPDLVRYTQNHLLELQQVTPHFQGRSGKCLK